MSARDIPLILFAKAPVAGQVKTRLQPQLNQMQCAEVARLLLQETLSRVVVAWPGRVELAVWPDLHDEFLQALACRHGVTCYSQVAGDLGQKMHAALTRAGYPAAVMGCDAPQITPDDLRYAHHCLSSGGDVVGPSQDGGYYLLGLSREAPELFTGVGWGSDQVLATTLARMTEANRTLTRLPTLIDIDTWDDLLANELPVLRDFVRRLDSAKS